MTPRPIRSMKACLACCFAVWLAASSSSHTKEAPLAPPPLPEPKGHRAWLGVFLGDALDGGVQVIEVVADSPAGKAGLEPGDIVLRLNDRPVENRAAADAALQTLRPGEEVRVRIVREGEVEDRTVVVGNRATARVVPRLEAPEAWEVKPGGPGQQVLGLRWVDVPEDLRAAWGAPREAGVVVARVAADGAAAKAGVKVGDVVVRVNGVALETADRVPYVSSTAPVRLEVVRRGSSKPLALELTPLPAADATQHPPSALGDAERRKLESEIERLQEEVRRLSEELKRERSAQ